jgi:6-phosphofructokinase 2
MLEAESMSQSDFRLGGASATHLFTYGPEQLIHKEAIEAVAVQSWTRESFVAVDDNTNSQ